METDFKLKESTKSILSKLRGQSGLRIVFTVKEIGSIAAVLLMSVILTFLSPYFLTVDNLLNVSRQISTLAIIAIGMTFVIIAGEIDLSVGSIFGLSAVVLGKMIAAHINPIWAILTGLMIGVLCGLVNGLLVTKVGIPSFVATLGTMSALRGLALVLTNGWPVSLQWINVKWFFFLGGGYLFNLVPMQAVFMLVVLFAGIILLKKTNFGYHVYAVGGNPRAATLSGISVPKIKILSFTLIGFLCSLAAVLSVSFVSSAEPNLGLGMELDVIAAAVIGGISLAGGVGSVLGAFLGAATIGILYNGLVLMGTSPFIQKVLIGVVIITAVALSERVKKTRK